MDDVNGERQHDLDDHGHRQECARREDPRPRRRDGPQGRGKNAQMAKLYREVVLKEKPAEGGFVPISALGGIAPAAPKPVAKETKEEVGSFGD